MFGRANDPIDEILSGTSAGNVEGDTSVTPSPLHAGDATAAVTAVECIVPGLRESAAAAAVRRVLGGSIQRPAVSVGGGREPSPEIARDHTLSASPAGCGVPPPSCVRSRTFLLQLYRLQKLRTLAPSRAQELGGKNRVKSKKIKRCQFCQKANLNRGLTDPNRAEKN